MSNVSAMMLIRSNKQFFELYSVWPMHDEVGDFPRQAAYAHERVKYKYTSKEKHHLQRTFSRSLSWLWIGDQNFISVQSA